MKTAYIEIGGKQYPLRFGIGAAKAMSEKFGSLEKMVDSLSDRPENEIIEALIWLLEALIRQGCSYKNIFESDSPIPDDAPVKEGKYIPLSAEEIEVGLEITNISNLQEIIFGTVLSGSKSEVETKPKGKDTKNAETT
jgi:hypothetical protein